MVLLDRLRAAARMAAQDAKVKEVILNAGSPILYQDTADFDRYVQADAKRMAEVVKKIGKIESATRVQSWIDGASRYFAVAPDAPTPVAKV